MKKITKKSTKISIKKPKKITIKNQKSEESEKNSKNLQKKIVIKKNKNNLFFENSKELKESYLELIKKEEYYNFLQYMIDNELLSKCMEKEFRYYYESRAFIYPYPDSNIQFITYIKNSKNEKNYSDFAKLQLLLNNFVSFDFTFKIISYIMKNYNNNNILKDSDIINYILNENSKKENIHKNFQCKSSDFIVENLSRSFKKYLKKLDPPINIQDTKILDLGCINLKRFINISKYLNINKKNIYGSFVDSNYLYDNKYIINIHKNKNNINLDNFKKINSNLKLDFPDNSFDVIYCEFFLQRIINLNDMLREIKRILKPNGYIMIISTMCIDVNDRLLSDIWNTLRYTLEYKDTNYLKKPLYERYYDYTEWDYILSKHNLVYITENLIYNEVKKKTSSINYTNYAIYQNIKN